MTENPAYRPTTTRSAEGEFRGGCLIAAWACSLALYLAAMVHPLAALLALLVPSLAVLLLTVVNSREVSDPVARGLLIAGAAIQVLVLVPLVASVPLTARVDRGGTTTSGFLVSMCVTMVAVVLLNAIITSEGAYRTGSPVMRLVISVAAALAPTGWVVAASFNFLSLDRSERYGTPASSWFEWSLIGAILATAACFFGALLVALRGRVVSRTAAVVALVQVITSFLAGAFAWFLIAYHLGT